MAERPPWLTDILEPEIDNTKRCDARSRRLNGAAFLKRRQSQTDIKRKGKVVRTRDHCGGRLRRGSACAWMQRCSASLTLRRWVSWVPVACLPAMSVAAA